MIRTMVAGLGNMGRSHALAYHRNPAFDLVGLVNRSTPRLDPACVSLRWPTPTCSSRQVAKTRRSRCSTLPSRTTRTTIRPSCGVACWRSSRAAQQRDAPVLSFGG